MARNLFRVTVDEPNYSRVLGTSVENPLLEDANLESYEAPRFWAQKTSENGKQVYETMSQRDGVFFYKVQRGCAKDEGQYVGVGRIGEKIRLDESQAESLFKTSVAQLAFMVTEFEQITKSIEDVKRILGYKSHPQSSHRVTEDRYSSVAAVLRRLSD